MPEDVAFFVAKNVRANVRELEGALRKVLAYSRFSQKDINIALAREALKDLLSIQNRQIGVENIQKTVADFYKIKVADMYSKKRPASIARPRQIAMYLAKELTQKSLPEIGELFGGRDHTTVLHAVRKIGGERSKNTELNQQLHVLEQTLKGCTTDHRQRSLGVAAVQDLLVVEGHDLAEGAGPLRHVAHRGFADGPVHAGFLRPDLQGLARGERAAQLVPGRLADVGHFLDRVCHKASAISLRGSAWRWCWGSPYRSARSHANPHPRRRRGPGSRASPA